MKKIRRHNLKGALKREIRVACGLTSSIPHKEKLMHGERVTIMYLENKSIVKCTIDQDK